MDNSKALAILNQNAAKGLVFARREEIEAISPQYEPIVTVLEFEPADFIDVGMGNMYPGKAATNRISDATGVSFLRDVGGTREVGSWSSVKVAKQAGGFWQASGEYKVIGTAQGQRLKPDGTPRLSSVREYEFNIVDRANEDFLKDATRDGGPKYASEVAALKHLYEIKKFATQRASTGAELAVVRELVGMPTAFKKDQIAKPMIFSQVVENNRFKVEIMREVMKSPDGRQAVVGALFGAANTLYGPSRAPMALPAGADQPPERQVGPEPEAAAAAGPVDDWGEPAAAAGEAAAVDPELEKAVNALRDWTACGNPSLAKRAQAIIDRGETDLRILRPSLEILKHLATADKRGQKDCADALDMLVPDPIVLESIAGKIRGLSAVQARAL
jgi:hypothetical protein